MRSLIVTVALPFCRLHDVMLYFCYLIRKGYCLTRTIIGVDVGGTLIRAACFDSDLNMLERAEQPSPAHEGHDAVFDRLLETIRPVFPESPDDLLGIGMAIPGPIDPQSGMILKTPNLPFEMIPIRSMVQKAVGGKVYMGNDADLAGLGESVKGAGRDVDSMVYVTLSTGIGGGIIIDKKPFIGSGQAGEIGHIVVEADGPLCGCGGRGHLEALASGVAIARIARERLAGGETSIISDAVDGDLERISAKEVGDAAHRGDPLALEIITQAGRYLGIGIASIMVTLNPARFVLGGSLTKIGDLLFDPMHSAIREYVLHPRYYEGTSIVLAELGDDMGLIGAAALVLAMQKG